MLNALGKSITYTSPRERRILVCSVVMTTVISVAWLIYDLETRPWVIEFPEGTMFLGNPIYLEVRMRIAGALIVAATAIWSRRVWGLLVSAPALVWILGEYARWFVSSIRGGSARGLEPALAYLWGATWWDIPVLIITVAVLTWQIKILVRSLKSPGKNQYAGGSDQTSEPGQS